MENSATDAQKFNLLLSEVDYSERLKIISEHLPNSVFTSSLGIEDQFITHLIATHKLDIKIITLDTGRLFPQTLELLEKTRSRYSIDIKAYQPDPSLIETYVDEFGLNGFYESVIARQQCCNIRKMIPLNNALSGAGGWVTGLRREQSANRDQIPFAEFSDEYRILKFNPLADLKLEALNSLVKVHNIPINPLHSKGYPSIGCEPCTRALKPGENERAGRWWWEQEQARECGLHDVKSNQVRSNELSSNL